MEINNIKIDKTAYYPKSFSKKLISEQKQYKDKTDTDPKEDNSCTVEEVDCEKSIVTLSYTEPKYQLQGKPVKKRIKTADNQQARNDSGNFRAEKMSTANKNTVKKSTESNSAKGNAGKISTGKVNIEKANIGRVNTVKAATGKTSTGKASNAKAYSGKTSLERVNLGKASSGKVSIDKVSIEKVSIEKVSTENENTIKTITVNPVSKLEEEKCVIEEVDCKMSLIYIGYDETQEEENEETIAEFEAELEAEFKAEFEAEIDDSATVLTEADVAKQNSDTISQAIENRVESDSVDQTPDYDINKYFSSGIIGTVVLYADDMEDVIEEPEELSTSHSSKVDDTILDNKITNYNNITDVNNIVETQYNAEKVIDSNTILVDQITESNTTESNTDGCNTDGKNHKSDENLNDKNILKNKAKIGNKHFKKVNLVLDNLKNDIILQFGALKNETILQLGALHTKNKLGYFSLLALLGLLGFFTENKACLGFWAFLYFLRYFFVVPDEKFKTDVQESAASAFFIVIAISLLFIVLEALFHNTLLLIFGIGVGTVISTLVFAINLAVKQMGKDSDHNI